MKGKFWRSARLPGRGDAAALAVLALAAFFLWNHPDIQETAQHVHILLDDLFSGQFFENNEGPKAFSGYFIAHFLLL